MSFCTVRFHSRQTLWTSQSTSLESAHLLTHLHYSPEFSRLSCLVREEGVNTAGMNCNFLWSFQLLGWQTLHRREAQSISQSWWAWRSYMSPRCKVTGVPLHCFSLMCTCEAQKAPHLIPKPCTVSPISSDLSIWLSYSISLWPGCPVAYASLCSATNWDLNKLFKHWQAFSSMKTSYELGNHIFSCAACQKSTQTSNSKEMRSFWSTAKISTFPLLVLDAAPTHSMICNKWWDRGAVPEKKKKKKSQMTHDLFLRIYLKSSLPFLKIHWYCRNVKPYRI